MSFIGVNVFFMSIEPQPKVIFFSYVIDVKVLMNANVKTKQKKTKSEISSINKHNKISSTSTDTD